MPEDTIDQADQAATLAETADDADTPAPGIAKVREELEGVGGADLGARSFGEAFARPHLKVDKILDEHDRQMYGISPATADTEIRLTVSTENNFEPGSFDTHAKDPQVEPVKKSPEEIERILFGDAEGEEPAPFNGPASAARPGSPYPAETAVEMMERLEREQAYEERRWRETACAIAARMHQGRGLNMRDFLDECDVIAEYIRDGYVPDFTA